MSQTHRRRGTLVPGTKVCTPEEDELVKTLPAEEVAKRIGRSLSAVHERRRRRAMSEGKMAGPAPKDQTGHVAEAD